MNHEICHRENRSSAERLWLIWWGVEPSGAALFQRQLLTFAIFLRQRIRVLVARAATNEEVWKGLRRIADEGWRIYRLRCQAIEAATLVNNYHREPAMECLKAAEILVRCFDGAICSNPHELGKLRADIAWLRPRYMGELLDRLRIIYCPQEQIGHPLDLAFWHLLPCFGVGVDTSVFEPKHIGSLPARMRNGQAAAQ